LRSEVKDLLTKRAIEETKEHRGYYSHVFLVPKQTGGWRPVFDLSNLNRYLIIPRFKMESALTIQRALRKDKWIISIDVKDAYFHIQVHKAFRRYLLFAYQNTVYQFRVLPFGVATAPYIFTRIVKAMAAQFRVRGIQFHHYIDDWLIVADSPQKAIDHARHVIQLATRLGWIPNWEKSCLTPTQVFEYVGVAYDLSKGKAFPPAKRLAKVTALVNELLRDRVPTARQMLSLIGLLASMEKQVPYGRCYLRPIQWCLAQSWNILHDRLDRPIRLNDRAIEAMQWWLQPSNHLQGMELQEYVPDRTFFTDASQVAWGAHMDNLVLSNRWQPHDMGKHINVLELKAVRFALEQWAANSPAGTKWLVFTDNTTVVAHINKQGGTRSLDLSLESEALIRFAYSRKILIKARHLPGKRNVFADALSRPDRILGTEWMLCPAVFQQLCRVFGAPNIDLFATSRNTQLPVFFSPLPESEALATDAISQKWDGMSGYAYPPTGFLTEVLHKITRSQCEVLLVAPCWPTQAWFPLLLSLLIDKPRRLPNSNKLLKQPGTSIFHKSPQNLRLHAWKLSSDLSKRRDFLSKCQPTWLDATGNPPLEHTKPNGECMFVGVTEDASIRSLPL